VERENVRPASGEREADGFSDGSQGRRPVAVTSSDQEDKDMSLGVAGYLAGNDYSTSVKKVKDARLESKAEKTGKSENFSKLLSQAASNKDTYVSTRNYVDSSDRSDADGGRGAKSGYYQGSGRHLLSQDITDAASVNEEAQSNVTGMSAEERTSLVQQLEADQESRKMQFLSMVTKSLGHQASEFENANAMPSVDSNGVWHFLASGNYTVDLQTKNDAQEAVSEDGYYGVARTSQRLFDFASSLAGDDTELMHTLQSAIKKGFSDAEDAWGSKLPEISSQTMDATNKLFENYFSSRNDATVQAG